MKKPFLLIAGDNQYPESGTDDWKGCFETRQEAENQVCKHFVFGTKYSIAGKACDWYEVVDLREWTE